MALPVLDKTWHMDLNVEQRSQGVPQADRRRMLFALKDKLCNLPVPWVVAGSSDGFTSGMDGPANGGSTDRWVDEDSVSFGYNSGFVDYSDGTTGVSWIVLRQSAINPKFELLIWCENANGQGGTQCTAFISPTQGFGAVNGGTNGSTGSTSPPTATDSIQILGTSITAGSAWLDGYVSTQPPVQDFFFHYWQSSDGECTRVMVTSGSPATSTFTKPYTCLSIFLEKPKGPIAEWTNPVIASWVSKTSFVTGYPHFNDISSNVYGNRPSGGEMKFHLTCESHVAAAVPEYQMGANALSGEWELYEMGLYCDTVGARGRHGVRYDTWWVSEGTVNGSTTPDRDLRTLDNMVMVWDGTEPEFY